jgi:antitoxin component of RelBE/YafQ-DinJ toxin-antitoxin module
MKEMTEKSIELANEIGHLSQQTGIATETLSVVKYAAYQADVPFELMSKSFKKLSTNLNEYESGSKTAKKAFDELGISQQDLQKTGGDLYKVFELIADRTKDMPDGFRKNAVATELFGKAGGQLIPLLNQGSASLQRYRQEAEALGIVLNEQSIHRMEELEQSLKQAKASTEAMGMTITSVLAPALQLEAAGLQFVITKLREYLGLQNGGGSASHADVFSKIPDTILGMSNDQAEAFRKSTTALRDETQKQLDILDGQHSRGLVAQKDYNDKKLALERQLATAELSLAQSDMTQNHDSLIKAQADLEKAEQGRNVVCVGG